MALGVVLGDQGYFDAAAYEFDRALGIALAVPGPTSPARIAANIANLHRTRAVALLAQGFEARALRESIALGRASRCPSAIVWVLCELGRLALAAGDLAEAQASYATALEIARELRPSRKIALACVGLAGFHAARGDPSAADHWRERAAEEAAAFEIARLQTRRQVR